jgi:glycopeptide antibiotics resistance protein
VFYYLFFLSIILEVFHLLIPVRGFELADVIGNLLGVFIILITYKIFKKNYEK